MLDEVIVLAYVQPTPPAGARGAPVKLIRDPVMEGLGVYLLLATL